MLSEKQISHPKFNEAAGIANRKMREAFEEMGAGEQLSRARFENGLNWITDAITSILIRASDAQDKESSGHD